MGVTISTEEISFLKDFGKKSIKEKDEILIANGMKPIEEDIGLREFLKINSSYIGLIRGICDLVLRKKEASLQAEIDKLNIQAQTTSQLHACLQKNNQTE